MNVGVGEVGRVGGDIFRVLDTRHSILDTRHPAIRCRASSYPPAGAGERCVFSETRRRRNRLKREMSYISGNEWDIEKWVLDRWMPPSPPKKIEWLFIPVRFVKPVRKVF